MVEAVEPVTGSFDLLHAEVHALGRAVAGAGAVVVQDLGPPLPQYPTKGLDFGDSIGEAGLDSAAEQDGWRGWVGR